MDVTPTQHHLQVQLQLQCLLLYLEPLVFTTQLRLVIFRSCH